MEIFSLVFSRPSPFPVSFIKQFSIVCYVHILYKIGENECGKIVRNLLKLIGKYVITLILNKRKLIRCENVFEKFSLNFPVAISYYSNETKRNSFNLTYIELQMVMKKVLNYS